MTSAGDAERQLAMAAKAWPFEEARRVLKRYEQAPPAKGYVLFETGYGPSGLPHIGTFGEVVRATMVRRAFEALSDLPTRLFAFSDDMDGLRKVPDNVPNKALLQANLGKPLTVVPDPFGKYESFGHHNNAMLRGFLDGFGFEYEFQSSTDWYKSGRFDAALLNVLAHYDEIMAVMLPTLGEERQQSYSPFLPISPTTGRVLQVPILETKLDAGAIVFKDEDGTLTELPVTGGRVKLQWKPDWGMRWAALGVDYEMSGKDLIPSVQLASKICRILGAPPPETYIYELFLDEKGEKISKSKGNGLSVEEWLAYAPPDSLAYYMYLKPRTAKRLFFDIIPRTVDEYVGHLEAYAGQGAAERLENPAWHIHHGRPPAEGAPLPYNLLLNLAIVANADNAALLWRFIRRYRPEIQPGRAPLLDVLVERAVRYYQDIVKPTKRYRAPTPAERAAFEELAAELAALGDSTDAKLIQDAVYEVGKRHPGLGDLRQWFKSLYETLLGTETGPRLGSFFALYGLENSRKLLAAALDGTLVAETAGRG